METYKMLVTPELATEWLEKNVNNRPLNRNHVASLAGQMERGEWVENGDPIRFDSEGNMIDGQHRCWAVIASGVAYVCTVVSGLAPSAFATIDVGKRRSAPDCLAIQGELNTNVLAAALAWIERYFTGRVLPPARFTNSQVLALMEKYPGVQRSIAISRPVRRFAPHSLISGCHYLFSMVDADEADRFFQDVDRGENLTAGDGALLLRERYLNIKTAKGRMPSEFLMAITIKAWNLRRRGIKGGVLKFAYDHKTKEAFPVIR